MSEKSQMFSEKLFYHVGTTYAITLNPANGHQFYDEDNRIGKFYNHMAQMLRQVSGTYTFYVEISEPYGVQQHCYDGPRLHIHGVLSFKTKSELRQFMFYGYRILCKYGRLEIGVASKEWSDYLVKQHIIPKQYRVITSKSKPTTKCKSRRILDYYK